MKTCAIFALLFFSAFQSTIPSNTDKPKDEVFIGVYDGLTEDMEFQFTDANEQVFLFDEVEQNLDYDLYDEVNFGQQFRVTWQKRQIAILDDEDEPTGETEEIKVIIGLKKI